MVNYPKKPPVGADEVHPALMTAWDRLIELHREPLPTIPKYERMRQAIAEVRSVDEAKKGATEATRQEHQQAIAALERQIEEHRAAIEAAMREHESVKQQCVVEEARLQGARVFFGYVENAAAPAK